MSKAQRPQKPVTPPATPPSKPEKYRGHVEPDQKGQVPRMENPPPPPPPKKKN